MTKPPKNPKSEAAQRWAIKNYTILFWYGVYGTAITSDYRIEAWHGSKYDRDSSLVAIFDLRDCYRKRQPLTGVTKKLRKAIAPRRKKK